MQASIIPLKTDYRDRILKSLKSRSLNLTVLFVFLAWLSIFILKSCENNIKGNRPDYHFTLSAFITNDTPKVKYQYFLRLNYDAGLFQRKIDTISMIGGQSIGKTLSRDQSESYINYLNSILLSILQNTRIDSAVIKK